MDISNALVIGMGLGTVFVGLICLIVLCYIMSYAVKLFSKEPEKVTKALAQPAQNAPIQNKQEILAAACAVIAEEVGTDANNIKVVSFKRV